MGPRVMLTGIGDSGPVWVWLAHMTCVFTVKGFTVISLAGLRDPVAVVETVERVLELMDAAAAGVPADE